MAEVQMSLSQILEHFTTSLAPESAGTISTTVQFNGSGPQGGKWWVRIHNGAAETGRGNAPTGISGGLDASRDIARVITRVGCSMLRGKRSLSSALSLASATTRMAFTGAQVKKVVMVGVKIGVDIKHEYAIGYE